MIYVLVPARDEASTVGLLLWKVRQVFTAFNREYQLIVVDDGSRDASAEVLAPYARALPMTLLTNRRPLGYARALETLFRETLARTDRPRRDLAVTIQADFSESPDDIPELIKRIEGGADVVIGSRAGRRGGAAARVLLGLARRGARLGGADDVVGTLRAYRLAVLERMVKDAGKGPPLARDGWAADVELLARAARYARKIESVPLAGAVPAERRASRARPVAEAWRALRAAWGSLRAAPAAPPEPDARAEAGAPATAQPAEDTPPDRKHRRRRRGGRGRGNGRKGRPPRPPGGPSTSSSAA